MKKNIIIMGGWKEIFMTLIRISGIILNMKLCVLQQHRYQI